MTDLVRHDVPAEVDTDGWTLDVHGTVERSLQYSREDLNRLPSETFTGAFACTEGWTVEGLSWRGVRVGTLLDRAGPTSGSEYALVRALDGDYACSFPLPRLSDAVLALELDGEALPLEHGGPARLVPTATDRDCWEHVKWVAAIEVTDAPPTAADTAEAIALSRIED